MVLSKMLTFLAGDFCGPVLTFGFATTSGTLTDKRRGDSKSIMVIKNQSRTSKKLKTMIPSSPVSNAELVDVSVASGSDFALLALLIFHGFGYMSGHLKTDFSHRPGFHLLYIHLCLSIDFMLFLNHKYIL